MEDGPRLPTDRRREPNRKLAGMLDNGDIDREVGRVVAVREHLKLAGSREEMAAAEKAAIAAVAADREQGSALKEQLAELDAKIKKLEADRIAACGRSTITAIIAKTCGWPTSLPLHVRDSYEADRRTHASNETAKEINAVTLQLHQHRSAYANRSWVARWPDAGKTSRARIGSGAHHNDDGARSRRQFTAI